MEIPGVVIYNNGITMTTPTNTSIDSYIPRSVRLRVKETTEEELLAIIRDRKDPEERRLLKAALFPGRRLRPILFDLALGHIEGALCLGARHVAVSLEIGHRASIILDDLIDGDRIRRGHPTFHEIQSPDATPLIVVALIGEAVNRIKSASLVAGVDLVTPFSETLKRMAYGERCDISAPRPDEDPLKYYQDRVLPKTSSLFEFLFLAASKLRSDPEDFAVRFALLGRQIGSLYQIFNDLYDVAAGPDQRGSRDGSKVTYSLLAAAFLKQRGFIAETALLRESIGKRVDSATAAKLGFQLLEEENVAYARTFARTCLRDLEGEIKQLVPASQEVLTRFLGWIQEKTCWDQAQFQAAGY